MMTFSEASEIVQEHTGEPLLESLEYLHRNIDGDIPPRVRAAYHLLMAGFMQMFEPAE